MKPPMKRIIVCCDGTWNDADTQTAETNVALMARSIHAYQDTGGVLQVVLYLRGVGTTGLHFETVFDGVTGHGIDDNILSAYMFIAQNYYPGDEIFLFGFSRGAYTARSLAGFIAACGVLQARKARRSGPGLAILPRPRPSLAARLRSVETIPIAMSTPRSNSSASGTRWARSGFPDRCSRSSTGSNTAF